MSWIVTPNLITITDADSPVAGPPGWQTGTTAPSTALTSEADINIQGASCASWGIKTAGIYQLFYSSSAAVNLNNQHLYVWFQSTNIKLTNTYANKGISVMVGLGGAYSINNIAGWVVDGDDTYPGGWQCYVVDCNRRPDWSGSGWTSTAIQNVQKVGMQLSCSEATTKAVINTYIDAIRYGSGLTIYSGSTSTPATWESLYQSDFTGSNKYGIVSKRAGVYFVQGMIQIGTPASESYFYDTNQIVQFESKFVSESLYRINITGSRTTCSFGGVIGSGINSIGINPIIIRGSSDLKKVGVLGGPASFTQSLRPVFDIGPEVEEFQSYSTQFADLKEINFGTSTTPMNGSKLKLVGNTFSNTFPITKNISGTASLELNNTLVSTTGSYTSISASHAFLLLDTGSIDSTQFQVLNTYGFTSTTANTTQTFTLTNHIFTSNTKYLTIYQNKTWNIINPVWSTPTTNSLAFVESGSNYVNEQYRYTTTVVDSNLAALSASKCYIYEGTITGSVVYRGQTDSSGLFTVDILKTLFMPSASTAESPRLLVSQSYGNFANKIYKYTYTPYIAGLTVAAAINKNIALVTDGNISETNQDTALASSSSIFVTKNSGSLNPVKVISYKSGSVAFTSGSTVTGASSGATGMVNQYIGDSLTGTVVLKLGNITKFTHNEILTSGGTSIATASVNSSDGGFSGSYTWNVECGSNTLQGVYDYLAAEMASYPIRSATFVQVLNWGQGQQSQLMYAGGLGYYTDRNTSLAQGVWLSNYGLGTINYITSDEGYQYIPPVQYTLTLTNLIAGSEVRVFLTGSVTGSMGNELAGIESSGTTFGYSYIYMGDVYVDMVVINKDYEYIRIQNVLITNINASIPIQQRTDRNYSNPQ